MRIADGFIFNDELDLLELRLMELDCCVDKFVLVESELSFSGKQKMLFYDTNKAHFRQWWPKIKHIVIRADDYKDTEVPAIEHSQRRAISLGMDGLDMTDFMLIGDADEIPSRSAVRSIRKSKTNGMTVMRQHLYYYYVNLLQNQPWFGTIALPRGLGGIDCQALRDSRMDAQHVIQDGGWHFSWLGDLLRLQYQLTCHTIEYDNRAFESNLPMIPGPNDHEHLRECLRDGKDLFCREDSYAKKDRVTIQPGGRHPETMNIWLQIHPEYEKKHAA